MSDDRTMIMANAVLNVRSSSPSFVSFDDGALNDLEVAARVVGASGAPANAGAESLFGEPLVGPRPVHAQAHAHTHAHAPTRPKAGGVGVAAFAVGGVVAVATAATLVFYFVVT